MLTNMKFILHFVAEVVCLYKYMKGVRREANEKNADFQNYTNIYQYFLISHPSCPLGLWDKGRNSRS